MLPLLLWLLPEAVVSVASAIAVVVAAAAASTAVTEQP